MLLAEGRGDVTLVERDGEGDGRGGATLVEVTARNSQLLLSRVWEHADRARREKQKMIDGVISIL